MASTFGGSVNAPLFSSDKPWVWAMIPVGFVIVIGAVALCLHSRRRMKHFEAGLAATSPSGATRLDPAGTRALERDLEEAWVRGATPARRPPGRYHGRSGSGAPSAAAGRWTRPTSRWQWAGGVSRQEEGLNELGEAPPPYEKQYSHANAEGSRKSSSLDGDVARSSNSTTSTTNNEADDGVELRNLYPPPPQPAPGASRMATTAQPISGGGENETGESARGRESSSSAVNHLPPPSYENDRSQSPTLILTTRQSGGEEERDGSPPPPPFTGGYDDGTAIVSVTPVPAAVLPSLEHRSA